MLAFDSNRLCESAFRLLFAAKNDKEYTMCRQMDVSKLTLTRFPFTTDGGRNTRSDVSLTSLYDNFSDVFL